MTYTSALDVTPLIQTEIIGQPADVVLTCTEQRPELAFPGILGLVGLIFIAPAMIRMIPEGVEFGPVKRAPSATSVNQTSVEDRSLSDLALAVRKLTKMVQRLK